jgi:hypothetical protein
MIDGKPPLRWNPKRPGIVSGSMNQHSNQANTDEVFLIGGGAYHNFPLLQGRSTAHEFRLDPIPASKLSLAGMNLFFAIFFGSLYLVAHHQHPLSVSIFVFAIWLVTAVGYTALVSYWHWESMAAGPALVVCKRSGVIRLPRHGQQFMIGESVWIECITAKHKNDPTSDWGSELNFVSMRDGTFQRWNLLRSNATWEPFNGLEREIQRETGIPVHRL